MKEPLRYDQLKHSNQIGTVMLIAFFFAVSANAYLGMRPLLDQIGAVSLQDFVASLWTAPAQLQLTFIVDFAAVLFSLVPHSNFSVGTCYALLVLHKVRNNRNLRG